MSAPFTVVIDYANGSRGELPFSTYHAALDACRNISYSGGRVRRVEAHEPGGVRAMWDSSWDAISQRAGLTS